MALKDALENIDGRPGRRRTCRICTLISELPADEADLLIAVTSRKRNVGPAPIAEALADEGYPGLFHAVKHHIYVCQAR